MMNPLTIEEETRYLRQMVIPEVGAAGQEKLRKASVVVIGAGGLGSPVLMYLASAGVGTLGVVDADEVSTSNLQRQILYVTADVTRSKAEAAAERLRQINPHTEVVAFSVKFNEENAGEIIRGFDIEINCSDNYATRYLLSDVTRAAGIPMISSSLGDRRSLGVFGSLFAVIQLPPWRGHMLVGAVPSGRVIEEEGHPPDERKPDSLHTVTISIFADSGIAKLSLTGRNLTALLTKACHTGAAMTPPVPGLSRLL